MFSKLKAAVDRYRTFKRTLEELEKLSDKDLYDIGITRGMIKEIAKEHATGIQST